MANIEKVVPAPEKSEPGFWRLLVAFLTDPGCRQAFKNGWNRAKLEQEAEAKETEKVRLQKAAETEKVRLQKAAEIEKVRLQKAAETRDKGDDSDGRIRCIVPNVMLEDTYYDNPCNPDIALNPCGNTEL